MRYLRSILTLVGGVVALAGTAVLSGCDYDVYGYDSDSGYPYSYSYAGYPDSYPYYSSVYVNAGRHDRRGFDDFGRGRRDGRSDRDDRAWVGHDTGRTWTGPERGVSSADSFGPRVESRSFGPSHSFSPGISFSPGSRSFSAGPSGFSGPHTFSGSPSHGAVHNSGSGPGGGGGHHR